MSFVNKYWKYSIAPDDCYVFGFICQCKDDYYRIIPEGINGSFLIFDRKKTPEEKTKNNMFGGCNQKCPAKSNFVHAHERKL